MKPATKNLMARLRRRWKRPQAAEIITLIGGPLDGQRAILTRPWGTLELEHKGKRGRYDVNGVWQPEPTNGRHTPADVV